MNTWNTGRGELGQIVTGCFLQESRQEKAMGPQGCWERWGDACGEKGDWAGLLWSPWLCGQMHWLLSSKLLPFRGEVINGARQVLRRKEIACIDGVTRIWTNTYSKHYLKILTLTFQNFLENTPNSEHGHLLLEDFNEVSYKLNP